MKIKLSQSESFSGLPVGRIIHLGNTWSILQKHNILIIQVPIFYVEKHLKILADTTRKAFLKIPLEFLFKMNRLGKVLGVGIKNNKNKTNKYYLKMLNSIVYIVLS